ncbi:hypothetical protein Tco_1301375 [Tanacetum coccineum]
MIPLYGDVDLTIMKSIHVDVESKLRLGLFDFLFPDGVGLMPVLIRVSEMNDPLSITCGAIGDLQIPVLLSGGPSALHRPLEKGIDISRWCWRKKLARSFLLFCFNSLIKCDSFPAFSMSSIASLDGCIHSCCAFFSVGD